MPLVILYNLPAGGGTHLSVQDVPRTLAQKRNSSLEMLAKIFIPLARLDEHVRIPPTSASRTNSWALSIFAQWQDYRTEILM